ncbi:diguanylate cyclase [Vibrio campbellii]|uniref:DEAD/DEAH box helicase n=1 Tax=Vibrio campbellii TaxID=680 RepID=UPI000CF556DB|nr:DEAD/DEAH box helicase family protein [Vibrio campbellii]PQJ42864.1 diguanylate cyclase [Vibrio campbellii]
MLRKWQAECVSLALSKYRSGHAHFLAQATPGAGKTIMAATLAKQMFDSREIDFVLCFSPSKAVADGIKSTFSQLLECSFNGALGETGCSMTYQSLRFVTKRFWDTLSKYKVLCIFDEIHHCGGDNELNSNSWGYQLLSDVQHAATFTLALTGTPWRSDKTPITLASYTDPEGKIVCDYRYSLAQAVQDGVCRKPKIALIDCEEVKVTESEGLRSYNTIDELLNEGDVTYALILKDQQALLHLIGEAVSRLISIQAENPNAGGLIVASSIQEANKIDSILTNSYAQSSVVVSYRDTSSHEKIKEFKEAHSKNWIVSVGMVSEGTDIPRLQVCCYLTKIKTELYFRQVLGRILRVTKSPNQEAWLYTFAESNMIRCAEEIETDIPDTCLYLKYECPDSQPSRVDESSKTKAFDAQLFPASVAEISFNWSDDLPASEPPNGKNTDSFESSIQLARFNQRVIEAFRGV